MGSIRLPLGHIRVLLEPIWDALDHHTEPHLRPFGLIVGTFGPNQGNHEPLLLTPVPHVGVKGLI